MLKKITTLLLIALFSLSLVSFANAATHKDFGLTETSAGAGYDKTKQGDIYKLVGKGVSAFLSVIAILFFAMMLYAGIRWMTARGNEELVGKAKTALTAAIIGICITVAAYAISAFVFGKMGLGGQAKESGESCCCKNKVCYTLENGVCAQTTQGTVMLRKVCNPQKYPSG